MAPATKARTLPPFNDPTDRLPSVPEGKSVRVQVTNLREWFDGWQLHREGDTYEGQFPVDEAGDAILPDHVVPAEEYAPPVVDLPGTNLARNRARVRGGASGMPNL